MTSVDSTRVATCQYNTWPSNQVIKPEPITEKKWTQEFGGFGTKERLTWDNLFLKASLQYGGGYQHKFNASILDTSSNDQRSFTLILEDQDKHDKCEALIHSDVNIDLKDYAKPGTKFKVMVLCWDNSGNQIGESTFA